MVRILLFALTAALLPTQALGQEPPGAGPEGPVLTLEQVLRTALGTNETIAQARENVAYSNLLRDAAWTALIPQASLQVGLIRNDTEQSIEFDMPGMESEEGGGGFTIQQLYDYNINLNVSQNLYLGGRIFKTIEQSAINIGLSEDQLSQTQRELLFQTAAAYAAVLKAQRNVQISQEALELANRQLAQAQVLLRAGEAVRTSVLRADAQVASAEFQLILSEQTLETTKQDLRVLTGIEGSFSVAPLPRPSVPAVDADELVRYGLEHRVELSLLDKQMDMAQLEAEKAFGEKLPSVNLQFTYTRQRSAFPSGSYWRLVLGVSVPIYDGGISTIRKAQQESAWRTLALERQLQVRQIRAEILQAYRDHKSLLRGLVAAEKQLESIRQAYSDLERFHRAGEATDLELQDARQQLIEAERIVADLTTDEITALLSLRRSLGLPAIEISEDN